MAGKPKVQIDEDGDGDIDVTVEIDPPPSDPAGLPPDVRDTLTALLARMEVVITPPVTRVTYAAAREVIRGVLN